jgi:hypothetical protein
MLEIQSCLKSGWFLDAFWDESIVFLILKHTQFDLTWKYMWLFKFLTDLLSYFDAKSLFLFAVAQ